MARSTEMMIHGVVTPVIELGAPAGEEENTLKAEIAAGLAEEAAASAAASAKAAVGEAANAEEAATEAARAQVGAEAAKTDAQSAATAAKSWAVGGTGTREGEDTNNAKYWAQTILRDELEAIVEKACKELVDSMASSGIYIPVSEKGTDGGVAVLRGIRTRVRDPDKPTYGLGGGGDDGGDQSVALKVGPYTGTAEISVVVSGDTYDAENLGFDGENDPDETIIIKTEEF